MIRQLVFPGVLFNGGPGLQIRSADTTDGGSDRDFERLSSPQKNNIAKIFISLSTVAMIYVLVRD